MNDDSLSIDFSSPFKMKSMINNQSNFEDHPIYKSIVKMHINSPSVMVPVPTRSSPAKKERKLPLRNFIMGKNTMQLLKPETLEILLEPPYASGVFLHCFV